MEYISPFFIGYLAAFLGLIAPGMLNMTAARTSIEYSRSAGIQFSLGASSIVFIQAFIAVTFAKYLVANPDIINNLKVAAVFVLFGLAVFFFMQARKEFKATGEQKKGNFFVTGLGMSSFNMLAIPFYLAMATLAESKGWMENVRPYNLVFVTGAVLGAFSIYAMYSFFADFVAKRAQFIARNINYILSGLFVVLGFTTLAQVTGVL